jgi:hypothetical protein
VARWHRYQVPADTGLFTPLGLQPAALFRLGFNGAGHWLSQHAISHRRLVCEHHTGLVIWSAQLIAGEPVSFLDADCLELRVMGRVRGEGTQFECEGEVIGASGSTTRLQACCIPLRLDGDPALSGIPARLSPEVMAAFLPDEIEARPHRSPVPAMVAAIANEGTLLARGQSPFTIYRHQCEVADQWFWPEAASLASRGREDLVRTEADRTPRLRPGLAMPVLRLDLVFNRPFFLFDQGTVLSSAYEWQDRLVFVHDLVGAADDQPRASVLEQFTWP